MYERAMRYPERIDGILYFEELGGPGGMWVCLFIPRQDKKAAKAVADAAFNKLCNKIDIVGGNWCFAPEGAK